MKVKEVIKRLEAEGWVFETVSGIDGKDVSPGQLQDIKRKAGWK